MSIFKKRRPTSVRGFRTNDLIESLEMRLMLSAAAAPVAGTAHYDSHIIRHAASLAEIQGYSPTQIRHAYGFDQVSFAGGSVAADGAGQTIAIVDAYNNPDIITDLGIFDAAYGLNAPPSFSVVNQSGGSALPATDGGWAGEIALDVEWAHAIAPMANIVLVEANSAKYVDLLAAVDYARTLPNVSTISMSWGSNEFASISGVEFSTETQLDTHFITPAGHQGITFIASAGDSGVYQGANWPSASPNVLSVGGTSLFTSDASGTYSGESSWLNTGGGASSYEAAPSYQSVAATGAGVRVTPDVSFDGDPGTGFPIYNTIPDPLAPDPTAPPGWVEIGGTSAGAPQWASLIAIANQGRALLGKPTLDGPSGTLPTLYSVYSKPTTNTYTTVYKTYFNDVIDTAANRFLSRANSGYDDLTGLGTPKVASIMALLGGAADTGLGGGNAALGSANLQPSQVSGALLTNPPATAFSGSSGSIKMRVTNDGRAYSGDVKITVFATTQTTLDGSATAIGTITLSKLNLKTGSNRKLTVKLNYPNNLPDGLYFIIATTNTVGTSTAPILSLAPKSITISHPKADLATFFTGGNSVTVNPGHMATANITVQNIGNVKATGLWNLSLFASLDSLLDGNDALLTQLNLKKISLAPGRSLRLHIRFLAPASLVPGNYSLIATTSSTLRPTDANALNDVAITGTV